MTEAGARVIVTADDYGLSRGVDDGILRSFHEGVVRSTTVLVNFPDAVESVARLPQAGLELGIHLNLTAGPPCCRPGSCPAWSGAAGSSVRWRRSWPGPASGAWPGRRRGASGRRRSRRASTSAAASRSSPAIISVHMLPPLARIAADSYDEFLDELGVTRSRDLLTRRSKAELLVAGVKVATQTPPIRSGRRVIFLTLDDATGPVDATFFEDAQGPYAATVFHSWLLVVRGELRRTGYKGVSLRATGCWSCRCSPRSGTARASRRCAR